MTGRDGLHECPWPGCTQRVPRHLWGCKSHWYRVPRELRSQLSRAYRHGSVGDHVEALEAIDQWLEAAGELAPTGTVLTPKGGNR